MDGWHLTEKLSGLSWFHYALGYVFYYITSLKCFSNNSKINLWLFRWFRPICSTISWKRDLRRSRTSGLHWKRKQDLSTGTRLQKMTGNFQFLTNSLPTLVANIIFWQECIPAGCVPPACWPYPSMHCTGVCVHPSMHWALGCLPRGVPAQGGVYPSMQWGRHPPCGQTDPCENITFANFVCGR